MDSPIQTNLFFHYAWDIYRTLEHMLGTKFMFGFAVRKIGFDIIDSVKLILTKNDFNLKWFMFGYIHTKVG
jgi:hypothetical protein